MKKFSLILIVLLGLSVLHSCSDKPKQKLLFSYNFDDGKIGEEWKNEGGDWSVMNGRLHSENARNRDLVLLKPLPAEAMIEVEMISHSEAVDIKFRAWGDIGGNLHDGAYHFILGGWGNKISTIAPKGEHDKRRVERKAGLDKEKWYKVKVLRSKGKIEMFLDGKPYLTYNDTEPLDPSLYKYFSFANWNSDCEFDNLKIYELPSK